MTRRSRGCWSATLDAARHLRDGGGAGYSERPRSLPAALRRGRGRAMDSSRSKSLRSPRATPAVTTAEDARRLWVSRRSAQSDGQDPGNERRRCRSSSRCSPRGSTSTSPSSSRSPPMSGSLSAYLAALDGAAGRGTTDRPLSPRSPRSSSPGSTRWSTNCSTRRSRRRAIDAKRQRWSRSRARRQSPTPRSPTSRSSDSSAARSGTRWPRQERTVQRRSGLPRRSRTRPTRTPCTSIS